MRFFLDENFPKPAMGLLAEFGHEGLDIRGTPDEGMTDEEIFARAQSAHAVFLTTDMDFFHTIPFLHPSHHGVVVVALRQPNRDAILGRLRWFLAHLDQFQIPGHAVLLKDNGFTIYPGGSRE